MKTFIVFFFVPLFFVRLRMFLFCAFCGRLVAPFVFCFILFFSCLLSLRIFAIDKTIATTTCAITHTDMWSMLILHSTSHWASQPVIIRYSICTFSRRWTPLWMEFYWVVLGRLRCSIVHSIVHFAWNLHNESDAVSRTGELEQVIELCHVSPMRLASLSL